jgi:hypothetical protein
MDLSVNIQIGSDSKKQQNKLTVINNYHSSSKDNNVAPDLIDCN